MYEIVIIEFIFYIIAYGEKGSEPQRIHRFALGYGLLRQAGYAEGL